MHGSTGSGLGEERLLRLLEVGRSLVAELDVDAVLHRVLEVARELTGARYAAIGVIDPAGRELERFLTLGIDEDARRAIGNLPRGRGVLGVLIDDPRPIRLADVGRHSRSYGFPPGHPPMTTFLGAPIRLRDAVYGNLYLTDKAGGEFDDVDEEAVGVLADWAAIAIDNARAYAAERDRRHELEQAVGGLEATIDITRALGGEIDLDRVLELICKRSRALVDAKLVLILLADEGGATETVAALAGEGDDALLGAQIPVEGSLSGRVLASREPLRLTEVGQRLRFALAEHVQAQTGLMIPLVYRGTALGVLCAFDRHAGGELTADDERLLAGFAASAAIAVATAQRVAEQGLRRSIEASERERTRWARELHDETLQELAGLKVLLASARPSTPDETFDAAIEQIDLSITGLRQLITELRPAALDEYGLGAAVEALVERVRATSGLAIDTEVSLAFESGTAPTRLDRETESTLYRLVQEGLTNAARHADAETIHVVVREDADALCVEVRDDGAGFDADAPRSGFGLVGMRERVALAGGTFAIASVPGQGTSISATVPARHQPADDPAAAKLDRAS